MSWSIAVGYEEHYSEGLQVTFDHFGFWDSPRIRGAPTGMQRGGWEMQVVDHRHTDNTIKSQWATLHSTQEPI